MRISDWRSDVWSSDLATVPESLVARAEAAGSHMFRRYGMSEHPTVTQGADGDPLYVRMTTDGRLRPGVELRIVDDDGNDVETGTEGEVATSGPDMFLGYSDPDRKSTRLKSRH